MAASLRGRGGTSSNNSKVDSLVGPVRPFTLLGRKARFFFQEFPMKVLVAVERVIDFNIKRFDSVWENCV